MNTQANTQVEAVRSMTNKEMVVAILALQAQVEALSAKLEAKPAKSASTGNSVEMTDEHAQRVKFGDLKDEKHGKAAEALGLTYGQVYSARKGFTFKHIKEAVEA